MFVWVGVQVGVVLATYSRLALCLAENAGVCCERLWREL
jgi:hypothetical protein